MKKVVLIAALVIMVLAMTVPSAFAGTWYPPTGNNTNVTVYGKGNNGVVVVSGARNNTSLYFGPWSYRNVGVIGVTGCGNNTNLKFGTGAKYNTVGIVVVNPCR